MVDQHDSKRKRDNPARYFARLRRSLKRYREGKITAEVLATSVERFLEWDAQHG